MSAFYKMDPARWNNGTSMLSLEQEAAYLRIINAIHLHDEALVDDDRVLAGLFRCDKRKARRLKMELIAAGKIVVIDATIHNRRADDDLTIRRQLSDKRKSSGKRGGIASGKSRSNPLRNNGTDEANASPRIEENRIEEKRTEDSFTESPRGVPSLKEDFDRLRDQLCDAAGWQSARANGNLEIVGPIHELIRAGADLDLDVLPVIRAKAAKCRTPSWRFFVPAIRDAWESRLSAGTPLKPPQTGGRKLTEAERAEIEKELYPNG